MAQFATAYVVLGLGVLLLLAGVLTLRHRSTQTMLTDTQRGAILGGVFGMLAHDADDLAWREGRSPAIM